MKTYDLKTEYGNYKVYITTNKYRFDNSLAIELTTDDGSPFATLTVCLADDDGATLANDAFAFVDTNNCPWAPEFIEGNGLGKRTGIYKRSGWCEYPLYEFDLEKLSK